jgi:hypothetical protein
MTTTEPATPGVATAFNIFGWVLFGIGLLTLLIAANSSASDAWQGIAEGIGAMLFSLVPFGFAALIARLHLIEHHLRPHETHVAEIAALTDDAIDRDGRRVMIASQ